MKRFLYHFIKRLFDILFAVLAIVITSPLWLICILGIKLSSPGPLVYRSNRAGRNNQPFVMYKFRSMHVFQPQQAGQRSEGTFVGNARIFPFGAFMRKAKLDELPQMLNILLGQMSIVGPRPVSVKRATETYVGDYAAIAQAKPGLACLDSLFDYAHGELFVSDNEQYKQKVIPVRQELARIYVQKQSLALDLYCIGRTLKLVFEIVLLKKRNFPHTRYEQEAETAVFGTAAVH